MAALLLSPLTHLLGDLEWIYPPADWSDAYINMAYSHFHDVPGYKADYYKAARVPWLAPLFQLQKLTGPELLTPVVVVGGWVALGAGYLWLLANLVGSGRALAVLPWLLFFPHIVGRATGGGTYHGLAALLYLLVSLTLWIKREGDDEGRAGWAGVFLASALHTNILYLNFLLIYPLLDFRRDGRAPRVLPLAWLLLGFIGGTIFWGATNAVHGRPLWFFLEMWRDTVGYLNPAAQEKFHVPLSTLFFLDFGPGTYLVGLMAAFLAALARLASRLPRAGQCREFLRAEVLTLNYVFLFLLWVGWHAIGQTALHPHDFAYPLQLPAIMMVAAWLPEDTPARPWWALAAAAVMAIVSFYAGPQAELLDLYDRRAVILPTLAIGALLPLLTWVRLPRPLLAVAAALMLVAFAPITLSPHSGGGLACQQGSAHHHFVLGLVAKLRGMVDDPYRVFVYPLENRVVPLPAPCEGYDMRLEKFAHNTWLIMGDSLSRRNWPVPPIDELTATDFEWIRKRDGILLLFPADDATFIPRFLAKAASLGVAFERLEGHSPLVGGVPVPYEIHRLKRSPTDGETNPPVPR